ncbi:MAG: hypothetical protein ABIP54_03580 [Candidatus Andersenbacteria bacterium]
MTPTSTVYPPIEALLPPLPRAENSPSPLTQLLASRRKYTVQQLALLPGAEILKETSYIGCYAATWVLCHRTGLSHAYYVFASWGTVDFSPSTHPSIGMFPVFQLQVTIPHEVPTIDKLTIDRDGISLQLNGRKITIPKPV